jgi:hypothetical protein
MFSDEDFEEASERLGGSGEPTDIWMEWFVPDREMTEEYFADNDNVDERTVVGTTVRVYADVNNFEENGVLSGEETELKKINKGEYGVYDVESFLEDIDGPMCNTLFLAKSSVEVGEGMSSFVLDWLERMCDKFNLEYDSVVEQVEHSVRPYFEGFEGRDVLFTGHGTNQALVSDGLGEYTFD